MIFWGDRVLASFGFTSPKRAKSFDFIYDQGDS